MTTLKCGLQSDLDLFANAIVLIVATFSLFVQIGNCSVISHKNNILNKLLKIIKYH